MEEKKLTKEEFRELCKEAIPHIEALQKILKDRKMENLGSLTFGQDGYTSFSAYESGWELVKTNNSEYRMRQEIGLED